LTTITVPDDEYILDIALASSYQRGAAIPVLPV